MSAGASLPPRWRGQCCGPPSGLGATLDRLRAFVRETQTARARVHAERRRPERPRGRKAPRTALSSCRGPGKFRWTVEKPYQQLLVGDGQRVWVYGRGLEAGHRAQSRRSAGRHARCAPVRQSGSRERLRVEGPAGGGRIGLARCYARCRRRRHFPPSGWVSMRRAWPRSKWSTRSGRPVLCGSPNVRAQSGAGCESVPLHAAAGSRRRRRGRSRAPRADQEFPASRAPADARVRPD